ncbi:MAG: hypothetical protein ABIL68_05120 [bacterium]
MRIKIQIKTQNRELGSELMETSDSFSSGTKNELPGNATLLASGIIGTKMFGAPLIFELDLIINQNTDINIISEWLYLQLHNRCEQLLFNNYDVSITKNDIHQAISNLV